MTKRWICCTLVRFVIDEGAFKDLEVIELADK